MVLSTDASIGSYAQLITVLLLFVFVLGITSITTKYIAGYQKEKLRTGNMELVETLRISNTKYLQIVKVGERYLVMAICKDTVTMLTELEKDEIVITNGDEAAPLDFKSLLEKAKTFHQERFGQNTDKGK